MVTRQALEEDLEIANLIEEEDSLDTLATPEQFTKGDLNRPLVKDISDPTRLITVYTTDTGEPRPVPAWTLEGKNSILRRVNTETGQREFSLRKPANATWKRGSVVCFLNPKHPDYAELTGAIGSRPPCKAEHLASTFAARIHGLHRHSQEFKAWEEYRALQREEEDRGMRRVQAHAAQVAIDRDASAPVAVKAPRTYAETFTCPQCGKELKTQFGLNGHLRSHK